MALAVLIIIKFFITFLIGYPFGSYIGIELILFSTIVVETGLLLEKPVGPVFLILENLFVLLAQTNLTAWWYPVQAPNAHDMLFTGIYSASFSFLVFYLSVNIREKLKKEQIIGRLDSAISQLTNANIGFQKYVKEKEKETIVKERKRVSREIHDAVGYSLTNIIMLLEAAALLTGKDVEHQKQAILDAKKQAVTGLEETRTALRHLREDDGEKTRGQRAVDELIKSFHDATGIEVKVEYSNLPLSLGDFVDSIIFRMIQEGMTNAFRHGMATVITIIFWFDESSVYLSIHDNGSGVSDIVEGIGLAGMRERLNQIGGSLKMKNVIDGFELSALIPVRGGSNESSAGR